METSILRASIKIGILVFQFLFLIPTYAQIDTIWHFQPDSVVLSYSLIQLTVDSTDGEIEHYYDASHKVIEKYNVINGKKYGAYRLYYRNETLREFYIYSNNIRHGEFTAYDSLGNVTIKGVYKKGLKHGYWAFKRVKCYGRYKRDEKNGKWKCFDEAGLLKSRVHYKYGTLLTHDKKKNKELKKKSKSEKKSKSDPSVEANKINNPRFRDNIHVGQEVYIVEIPGGSMENQIKGKVVQILTKSSFNGLGIKVVLENGKKGRVVRFTELPTDH